MGRQQFLVEQGYNYHVLRDQSVDVMDDHSLTYASHEAQLYLLKQVLESVKRGDNREADDEDVALHGPSSMSSAAPTATRVPTCGVDASVAGSSMGSHRPDAA